MAQLLAKPVLKRPRRENVNRSSFRCCRVATAVVSICGSIFAHLLVAETVPERIECVSEFALSPNGESLVFAWAGDLWTASVLGGEATQLSTQPGLDRQPCFSPDGREIAFVSDRDGSPQVYVLPVTGGAAQQLTFHSEGYSLEECQLPG